MHNAKKLIIACRHDNPNHVIATPDGEQVCRCGVVLKERLPSTASPESKSTISLYNQVENGCDPNDMRVINKKIHVYSSTASEFSNICSKLNLSSFVQQRAWSIYHRLRSRTYFTRAKCAVFSIYVACRESSQAVSEVQIRESVRSVLCVKRAPSTLSVLSEMHEEALKIGVDTNRGHSSSYYLNLEIAKRQHLFGDARDYDRFKVRVMNNFSHISGNSQNRARRAVEIAMDEMGVMQ